ncbi:NAD-dependent epimerase/dehydratase family protein [Candidatus Peribacteria bacterium]|nr:NAD-dependent epimerase/dehydratase family protein [Candidatus Peribacteria bacterium]
MQCGAYMSAMDCCRSLPILDSVDSFQGKTCLVTGGAGFIGTHLVRALLAHAPKRIVVLDSLKYGRVSQDIIADSRVTFLQKDFSSESSESLRSMLAGVDVLFHLAAEKHNQSIDDPMLVYSVNILGTSRLFEAACASGVRRIVFTSSLYAYGTMQPPAMQESDTPCPRTPYGISKLAGEHILAACCKTHGVEYAILRLFFVYGPGQFPGMGYKSVIVKNAERIRNNEPPVIVGDGTQALDYVYVSDVVDGILKVCLLAPSGTLLNLSSGVPTTILSLTRLMLDIAQSPLKPVFVAPDWTSGTSRTGRNEEAGRIVGWKVTTDIETGLRHVYQSLLV